MQLEHAFTVPLAPAETFRRLADVERVGTCVPGLTIASVEGRQVSGKLRVKIGPTQVTYRGAATVSALDAATRSVTIEIEGVEARGTGTARATILLACVGLGEGTQVHLLTDLALTGRAERAEAAVLAGVADRLLSRFATALSGEVPAAPSLLAGSGRQMAAAALGVSAQAIAVPLAEPAEADALAPAAQAEADAVAAVGAQVDATLAGLVAGGLGFSADDEAAGGSGPTVVGPPAPRRATPLVAVVAALVLLLWLVRRG